MILDQTLTYQLEIAVGTDDFQLYYENGRGLPATSLTTAQPGMEWDGVRRYYSHGFLVYQSVPIPPSATVLFATVSGWSQSAGYIALISYPDIGPQLDIHVSRYVCVNVTDCESLVLNEASTAYVPWDMDVVQFRKQHEFGNEQPNHSPNFAHVVQEIVDDPGYVQGDPLTILLKENYTIHDFGGKFDMESFEVPGKAMTFQFTIDKGSKGWEQYSPFNGADDFGSNEATLHILGGKFYIYGGLIDGGSPILSNAFRYLETAEENGYYQIRTTTEIPIHPGFAPYLYDSLMFKNDNDLLLFSGSISADGNTPVVATENMWKYVDNTSPYTYFWPYNSSSLGPWGTVAANTIKAFPIEIGAVDTVWGVEFNVTYDTGSSDDGHFDHFFRAHLFESTSTYDNYYDSDTDTWGLKQRWVPGDVVASTEAKKFEFSQEDDSREKTYVRLYFNELDGYTLNSSLIYHIGIVSNQVWRVKLREMNAFHPSYENWMTFDTPLSYSTLPDAATFTSYLDQNYTDDCLVTLGLNEGIGAYITSYTMFDRSQHARHGNLSSVPVENKLISDSFQFSNADTSFRITIPPFALSAPLSISFWFYPTSTATAQAIFSIGTTTNPNLVFSFDVNYILRIRQVGGTMYATQINSISLNTWNFIKINIQIDSVQIQTAAFGANLGITFEPNGVESMCLGNWCDGGATFIGKIKLFQVTKTIPGTDVGTSIISGGHTSGFRYYPSCVRRAVPDAKLLVGQPSGWHPVTQTNARGAITGSKAVDVGANKYLVIGGIGVPSSEIRLFDAATYTWQVIATDVWAALHGHSMIHHNGLTYIFGGLDVNSGIPSNALYEYDHLTNTRTILNSEGPAPNARMYHFGAVWKSIDTCDEFEFLQIGGVVGGSPTDTIEKWAFQQNITSITSPSCVGNINLTDCPINSDIVLEVYGTRIGFDMVTYPIIQIGQVGGSLLTTCDINFDSVSPQHDYFNCTISNYPGLRQEFFTFLSCAGSQLSYGSLTPTLPQIVGGTLSVDSGPAGSYTLINDVVGSHTFAFDIVLPLYVPLANISAIAGRLLDAEGKINPTYGKVCTLAPAATATTTTLSVIPTSILCDIGPWTGHDYIFQIYVQVGAFILTSVLGTDSFSYVPPIFELPPTILSYNNSISAFQISSPPGDSINYQALSTSPHILRFNVTNLGTDPTVITVSFGPVNELTKYPCTLVPGQMDLTGSLPTSIVCSSPLGAGSNLHFRVNVNGNVANQTQVPTKPYSFFTFSYPETPFVTKVTGCAADVGNTTTGCSTAGGESIVLNGTAFDLGTNFLVNVAGERCTDPEYVGGQLLCTLPSGTGYLQDISVTIVTSGGAILQGLPNSLISYADPVITSIEGCPAIDEFGWPKDCGRGGGDVITIHGANFGAIGAVVLIGGDLCTPVSHALNAEHTSLVCTMGSGRGSKISVVVGQAYGSISSSDAWISYAPCALGETEPDCSPCPVGTYSTGLSCLLCGKGKYSNITGAESCQICSSGHFTNDLGSIECQQCPPGRFANQIGSNQCTMCPKGTAEAGYGSTLCEVCPPGKSQSQEGQSSCSECSPGKFADVYGLPECNDCKPGRYQQFNFSSECNSCEAGMYTETTGNIECFDCVAGKFQAVIDSDSCLECPPGRYSSNDGESECEICEPGRYQSLSGETQCIDCEVGRFTEVPDSSYCDPCPVGKFQDSTKETFCHICPAGSFNNAPGSSSCSPCPPGTFAKNGECFECPSGMFNPDESSTECLPCAPGKYSRNGAPLCSPCEPGSYSIDEGSPLCTSCEKGTFSAVLGRQTPCPSCPAFTYAPNPGATECNECTGGPLCCEEYEVNPDNENDKTCIRHCTKRFTCSYCKSGTYLPVVDGVVSGDVCLECPIGVDCESVPGHAFAKEGWWISILPLGVDPKVGKPGEILAFKCLPGRCPDSYKCYEQGAFENRTQSFAFNTTVVPTNFSTTAFPAVPVNATAFGVPAEKSLDELNIKLGMNLACCTLKEFRRKETYEPSHRLEFDDNPMCGKCELNYYEWGNECLACTGVDWGFIVVVFFLSWGALLIFHAISQSTRAETKIFFYFIQMSLLFFGSNTPWLSWLNFINFNSLQSASNVCVAPMGPAGKLMINIWMPFVGLAELIFTLGLHFVYWVIKHKRFSEEYDGYKLRKSPYIRTACAMALFFYNNVTQAVFEFFKCVPVGNGVSVVETYPGLVCNGPEYNATRPIIMFFLFVVVIAEPIVIAYILYRAGKKSLLTNYKFLARYGVLYETYKPETFWWEMVPLVRRTALIVTSVSLASNDYSARMTALSIINLLLLMFHIFAAPFTKPVDNYSETFSLAALLLMTVGLINVDLPLSSGATLVFALLVFSPLIVFVVFQAALRFVKFGWPDEYKAFMKTEFMGAGLKGFIPSHVTTAGWAREQQRQMGSSANFWDNIDAAPEEEEMDEDELEIEKAQKRRAGVRDLYPSVDPGEGEHEEEEAEISDEDE